MSDTPDLTPLSLAALNAMTPEQKRANRDAAFAERGWTAPPVAPENIWIDHWGGNWSPVAGGTQKHEYVRADLHEAERARADKAEVEADCANDNLQTALKNAEAWKDRAEKAEAERDAAIAAMSEAARLRGEAEGKLLAAETPGLLEAWMRAAEQAKAERDALAQKLAKAIQALERIGADEFAGRLLPSNPPQDAAAYFARTTLAELTGGGQ